MNFRAKNFNLTCLLVIMGFSGACSMFRPYRASIGVTSNNTEYSKIYKNNGSEVKERVCVKDVHKEIQNPERCGNGYKADNGLGYIEPSLEFHPSYFGESHFGFSYFFSYNRSKTTLLDYPLVSEESDITIQRFSINPIIFYTLGDRYMEDGKGISFRIGLGASGNYVSQFKIKRLTTGETYHDDMPWRIGTSAFIEASYNWFIFKIESSSIQYDNQKFSDIPNDALEIAAIKVSFNYSYYFE